MASPYIRTREDAEKLPEQWYTLVEKAKEKARKLQDKVIAIDQTTSIVVGKLNSADIDKLWRMGYSYCKLNISNPSRYKMNGTFECKMGETELFFVNKPTMILTKMELADRFPQIYKEVLKKIKMDEFG